MRLPKKRKKKQGFSKCRGSFSPRLPDLDYTRLSLNDQDQVNRTEKDRKDLIAKAVMKTDFDSEVKFRLEMKDCK